MFKQSTGNKVNLVYKRQVWPALSWLRMFHEHQRGDLVRHLFLVDHTLDGLVDAFVSTEWTPEDERLLLTKRRDPAHQAT